LRAKWEFLEEQEERRTSKVKDLIIEREEGETRLLAAEGEKDSKSWHRVQSERGAEKAGRKAWLFVRKGRD